MFGLRFLMVVFLALLLSACSVSGPEKPAKAPPDNRENRLALAKRYLEAMPPKEMLHKVAERVGPKFAESERKQFKTVMASKAIENEAYSICLAALVNTFTTGELQALVNFYGSPEGQSAYKKFGPYMQETIPKIQQEVKKAMAVTQKQEKPQEPPGKKEPKAPGKD